MPAGKQLNKIQSQLFKYLLNHKTIDYDTIDGMKIDRDQLIQNLEQMREFDYYFTDFSQWPANVVHVKIQLITNYTFTETGLVIEYDDESSHILEYYWRHL